MTAGPNTAERLRRLLLDIYVASILNPVEASEAEHARLLDIVLDAAEGRPFESLGLPFPRDTGPGTPTISLPALAPGWVYVAQRASEALLDSGPPDDAA